MLDSKRDEIQNAAVDTWVQAGKKGTLNLSTGIGKTFCFIKATRLLPKGSKILFLAETTQREIDLEKDLAFFKKLFKYDLKKTHQLTFLCYQSAYKLVDQEWDFVCADEIHSSLTPQYVQFYKNNTYKHIMGLSATVDRNTAYLDEEGNQLTKGLWVDQIAPVCFKYNLNQAVEDGTTKKLRMFIINHGLDLVNKNVPAGTKAAPFMTTEKESYDYWDNQFKKALFLPDGNMKTFKIRTTSAARAKVLYTLPSKIREVLKLLQAVKGKTLVFGNSIEALSLVTPNVISNKNSEKANAQLRQDFDAGKVDTIASFKMLKQGANLKDLDNTILMSYYSKELDMIQAIGRQRVNNKTGNIFIYVTSGTQEIKWYRKAMENINNYEEIHCNSTDDCITKYRAIIEEETQKSKPVGKASKVQSA
jgi:superfamily II DNA or RNA helicase